MNRSYKSIWNDALGTWVAASELSSARAMGGVLSVVLALGLCGLPLQADAQVVYVDGETNATDIVTPAPGSLDLGIAAGSATQSGVISGGGGIIKSGAGTLALTGANTYQGPTALNGGILSVGDTQIGQPQPTLNFNGGVLRLTGFGFTAGAMTIGALGGTLEGTGGFGSHTISGAITGTGGLNFTGFGNFPAGAAFNVSSINNSFTGPISIRGGIDPQDYVRVQVNSADGALGVGPIIVDRNAALTITASRFSNPSIVAQNAINLSGAQSRIQIDSTDAGNTAFVLNGSGTTLEFYDATLGAATVVNNGGIVEFSNTTGLFNSIVNNGGNITFFDGSDATNLNVVNNSGRLYLFRNASVADLSGGGQIILANRRLTISDVRGASTISGVISDTGPGIDFDDGSQYQAPFTLTGGSVVKGGVGTLTLTANNLYTGGTTVSNGTLELGNGGTAGSVLGPITNNAVLQINRSDTFTLSNNISGTGALIQAGTGTTVLAAANTYTGSTTVARGTLRAGAANVFNPGSAHIVGAGGTLDLAGSSQTLPFLSNAGTVSLVGATPGTTLTLNGPYVGNGGSLRLGTALNAVGPSDRLVLDGPTAVASGTTALQITNLGGLGGQTSGNGIEVISALNGATTTAQTTKSAFAIGGSGHVDAGAFEYRLFAADASGAGENWYLRSQVPPPPPPAPPPPPPPPAPVPDVQPPTGGSPDAPPPAPAPLLPAATTYRAEVPMLAAVPAQLRQMDHAMIGHLHTRLGDEDASNPGLASLAPVGGALYAERRAWARAVYSDLDLRQPGVVSPSSRGHVAGLQAGTDLFVSPTGGWRGGIYVGTLEGNADISGFASGVYRAVGKTDLRSRYLGAYATYANATGFYADAVLQHGSHRYTISPAGGLSYTGKGKGLTASLEVGQAFALGGGWTLEPQAHVSARRGKLDNVTIAGAVVQQDDATDWTAGLGLRIKGDLATGAGRLQPYARVGVVRGSNGNDVARFANGGFVTPIASGGGYSSGEVSAGATLAVSKAVSVYGELGKVFALGGDTRLRSSIQGAAGVRVRW